MPLVDPFRSHTSRSVFNASAFWSAVFFYFPRLSVTRHSVYILLVIYAFLLLPACEVITDNFTVIVETWYVISEVLTNNSVAVGLKFLSHYIPSLLHSPQYWYFTRYNFHPLMAGNGGEGGTQTEQCLESIQNSQPYSVIKLAINPYPTNVENRVSS